MGVAVTVGTLVHELEALVHAEAVLLVDNHQRQAPVAQVFLEEGVGADDHFGGAILDGGVGLGAGLLAETAGQPRDRDAQRPKPAEKAVPVLLGEQLRRRHDGHLVPVGHGEQRGGGGDHGLAAAHVALHEPHHRAAAREIRVDVRQRGPLAGGELEA